MTERTTPRTLPTVGQMRTATRRCEDRIQDRIELCETASFVSRLTFSRVSALPHPARRVSSVARLTHSCVWAAWFAPHGHLCGLSVLPSSGLCDYCRSLDRCVHIIMIITGLTPSALTWTVTALNIPLAGREGSWWVGRFAQCTIIPHACQIGRAHV